jgi:Bacterial TSP3 repeat
MNMKIRRSSWIGALLVSLCIQFQNVASAQLVTNKWAALSSGKWENVASWDHGVPSINYSLHRLAPAGSLNAVATIDAATVAAHVINGCLTISNLTIQGGSVLQGTTASLVLNNANNAAGNIGLTIVDSLNINSRGSLTVTNSRLKVASSQFLSGDGLYINGSFLLSTAGELNTTNNFTFIGNTGSGQMTVQDGTWEAYYIGVGNGGQGTLTLAGGVTKTMSFLSLGSTAGTGSTNTGTGKVLMTGGELITTNSGVNVVTVSIGDQGGVGQMTISNGIWRSSEVNVTSGTLTIAGGTALLSSGNYGNLSVGYFGSNGGKVLLMGGDLTVTNDFTITTVGFARKPGDFSFPGNGQITVSNGIWRAKSVFVLPRDETNPDPAGEIGSGIITIAGGTTLISSNLTIGNSACTGTGVVSVAGGALFVTNAAHNAILNVSGGTLMLSSGTLTVDKLIVTNCGHFFRSGGTLNVGSVVLTPALDADSDGLPNYWEQQYGFDPLDQTTGVMDTDNDGLENFVEYVLGTDPLNASDPFHITGITKQGNDIRIAWNYAPPPGNTFQHYFVEASPTLTGPWTNVSGTLSMSSLPYFTISSTNYLDKGIATNLPSRFYRVRFVP